MDGTIPLNDLIPDSANARQGLFALQHAWPNPEKRLPALIGQELA
jgi:hypothetical protein